jgi:hypothetical protein
MNPDQTNREITPKVITYATFPLPIITLIFRQQENFLRGCVSCEKEIRHQPEIKSPAGKPSAGGRLGEMELALAE